MFFGHTASAQIQFGQIQGQVRNKDTGKALAGVTVVVSGPALQGDQTEFTDGSGRYLVTQLPPGDNYVVTFYFNDVTVQRPGIRITQNNTLTVAIDMPTQRGEKKAYVIKERAPSVDTANANVGQEINSEMLQNTATRGRTYESVLALAPGAVDPPRGSGGDIGVTISGSAGTENNFIIDGLNTTDPNVGLISTQVHQYFIKEINVITGGYQAEYGRATGGVVSVVTKSGSNEFHGGVFGSWTPFQADASTVARLGEALATKTRPHANQYDFGFDLGGPIVKDRIWFYVGFAPTFTTTAYTRMVRTQTEADGFMNPGSSAVNFGTKTIGGKVDPNFPQDCYSYLAYSGYCDGPRNLALATTVVPNRTQELQDQSRLYNWIGKLQFNINPDHNITVGYIGAPQYLDLYSRIRGDLATGKYNETDQIHDVTVRYIGKVLDRKLQFDILYGYHYQGIEQMPDYANSPEVIYRAAATNPFSLADFEDIPDCKRRNYMLNNSMGSPTAVSFNPCPITLYSTNGFGQLTERQVLQRHVLQTSATYYLRFLGNHAWKIGFDFEDNQNDHQRAYSGTDFDPTDPTNPSKGHYIFYTNPTGTTLRIDRAYQQADAMNAFGEAGVPCGPKDSATGKQHFCYNYFRAQTETRNYAVYLRDSWNVGFLPGLVLNLGVRWEAQEIYGVQRDNPDIAAKLQDLYESDKPIAIYDNWAPRIGVVYDFTRKGRSKLYFNYGRFYESIPMDINDRSFSGEGLLVGRGGSASNCPTVALQPGGRPLPVPQTGVSGSPCNNLAGTSLISGGTFSPVQPNLKGQYINEIVTGFQYDVGLDIVLGIGYTYRNMGNIIEDLSVDGANTYFVANPGVAADDATIQDLEVKAKAARDAANAKPMDQALQDKATLLESKRDVVKAISTFPQAQRTYHAMTLTANKRLSNRFSVLANYTYSRLYGNYPGTFSPTNGQLDPNISTQFDIIDLLANRNGPLPNDRPHNFKLTGFYAQPIGSRGTLTASLTFTAFSGRPINVLGFHPIYGAEEAFILPQGSGGRTPTITQFDLHIGYEHQLTKILRLSVFADVINLFNQQEVTNVDDEYTQSPVLPILNGKPEDIRRLKTTDGSALVINSNYGNATSYQEPLYLRFGARLAF